MWMILNLHSNAYYDVCLLWQVNLRCHDVNGIAVMMFSVSVEYQINLEEDVRNWTATNFT